MNGIPTKHIDGDVTIGRNITAGGNAAIRGNARIGHNLIVDGWLDAKNIKSPYKGLFTTQEEMESVYPSPAPGWWAMVGGTLPAQLWIVKDGTWLYSGKTIDAPGLDTQLNRYIEDYNALSQTVGSLSSELNAAQAVLSSVTSWNAQLNIRDIRVSGGAVTGEAGWDCSGFIPLNRDFPVTVGYTDVGVPPTVSLFDIGKRHLSTPQLDPKSRSVPVTAMPAGAAYFVVCARRDCGATWTNSPTREGLMHGLSLLLDRLAGMVGDLSRHTDTMIEAVDTRHSELAYAVNDEIEPGLLTLQHRVDDLMDDASRDRIFDDLWLTLAGSTGGIDRTGHPDAPYLLNGLWLARGEALMSLATSRHLSLDNHGFYSGSYIRTNLLPNPRCGHFPYSRNCEYLFNGCTYLEVARVSHSSTVFYNSLTRAFKGCTALHTVLGDIDLRAKPDVSEMFAGCAALETVSIVNLTQDISFADSPSLSTRSLRLLVNNAANTAPITITLHGSRYHDYICANGLPTSAGTPPVCTLMPASEMEDWKWLHAAMQEKQITFATAAA